MRDKSNTMDKQGRRLSFRESILSLLLRVIPIKHGKHRLLDIITPKAWSKSGMSVTFLLNGHKVLINPYDLVGWHFLMLRSFDPEVNEVLEKACNPRVKETLWDIGANKGACFCSLATKLPLLHIVAIEPQGQLLENNIINLESICPGRYEYVRAGVGEEEAELTLVIPDSNLGRASLHIQKTSPNDEVEVIKIQTASQIADNSEFGWPTVIKIDVEGHEAQVFRSLQPCIESKRCKVIVFENHAPEVKAFETIKAITERYGYEIYGIRKSPWTTTLVSTGEQLLGVTDYAVIRSGLVKENKRLAKLVT
jgi:FkbM family methyltransferase